MLKMSDVYLRLNYFRLILIEIVRKFSVTVSRTKKFVSITKDKSVNDIYRNNLSVLRIRHKTQKRQGLTKCKYEYSHNTYLITTGLLLSSWN